MFEKVQAAAQPSHELEITASRTAKGLAAWNQPA
jgi:hypothetical protein